MVKILSSKALDFPMPEAADDSGLVAIGGNYHWETLLQAYSKGIFPWFDEKAVFGDKIFNFIYWYSPDPRFVLFREDFRIGKRTLRYYRKSDFSITFNKAFYNVMKACQIMHSFKKNGTWISNEMIAGYYELFKQGYCMSVEVWKRGKLIGGLYGVKINKYFCGESMFSIEKNASKFAFIALCKKLFSEDFKFIDCQVYSNHINRFGAVHIPRNLFLSLLSDSLK